MKIHLHIDRLIVEGLHISSTHGGPLKAALSAELSRLLATQEWSSSLRSESVAYLRGNTFSAAPSDSPRQLGNKIAKAVHGGVRRAG